MDVESQQLTAKSGHDAGKDGSDLPGADHGHRATHEIETHETVEREIPLASAIVGPRNLAIQREQQANGELGHGVRRIIDHAHDLDAELARRPQVDMLMRWAASPPRLRACSGPRPVGVAVFEKRVPPHPP